jgi:uncharacterized protein YkuJ
MAKKIMRLTESDLVRLVKKVVNEQNEYGLDEPHYTFDREGGMILLVGGSSRQVRKILKNLPNTLKFLSFRDCDFADFDGIDLCSFPTLKNVNLIDTKNNFEEQGYECLSKWDERGQWS